MNATFKIKPGTIASIIIFILHGEKIWRNHNFKIDTLVETYLLCVIIASALLFWGFSLVTDILFPTQKKVDWFIQTGQIVIIYFLWDLATYPSLFLYGFWYCILTLSYLAWDFIHLKKVWATQKAIFWIDVIGFVLSVVFVLLINNVPAPQVVHEGWTLALGAIGISIMVQSLVGVIIAGTMIYDKIEKEKKDTATVTENEEEGEVVSVK